MLASRGRAIGIDLGGTKIEGVVLGEMLASKDRAKADRAMKAMLQMSKLDIAKLKQAYEQ